MIPHRADTGRRASPVASDRAPHRRRQEYTHLLCEFPCAVALLTPSPPMRHHPEREQQRAASKEPHAESASAAALHIRSAQMPERFVRASVSLAGTPLPGRRGTATGALPRLHAIHS